LLVLLSEACVLKGNTFQLLCRAIFAGWTI
jgi:hypothetical protein